MPPPDTDCFPKAVRLAESDEHGGNMRGERLLNQFRRASTSQRWLPTWQTVCGAHKSHSSAERTWEMCPALITGMVHMGLLMQQPGATRRFRQAMRRVLADSLRVITNVSVTSLPEEAREHKRAMLSLFMPSKTQPLKRALVEVVADRLLNGDWSQKLVQHFCIGRSCCSSP